MLGPQHRKMHCAAALPAACSGITACQPGAACVRGPPAACHIIALRSRFAWCRGKSRTSFGEVLTSNMSPTSAQGGTGTGWRVAGSHLAASWRPDRSAVLFKEP